MGIVLDGWVEYRKKYLRNAAPSEIDKAKHSFYHGVLRLIRNMTRLAEKNKEANVQGLIVNNILPDIQDYLEATKSESVKWFMENVIQKDS